MWKRHGIGLLIGVAAALLVLVAVLFWPVPEGARSTIGQLQLKRTEIRAERGLIALDLLVEPYSEVKKGQAIMKVVSDPAILDEAIAASRLRSVVNELLAANGGRNTPTVRQFREKIRYAQAMFSMSKGIIVIYAPADGFIIFEPTLWGRQHPKGTVLGGVVDRRKVEAVFDYPPADADSVKEGQRAKISGIKGAEVGKTRLIVNGSTMPEFADRELWRLLEEELRTPSSNENDIIVSGSISESKDAKSPYLSADLNEGYQVSGTISQIRWLNKLPVRSLSTKVNTQLSKSLTNRRLVLKDGSVVAVKNAKADAIPYIWQKQKGASPSKARVTVDIESPELVHFAVEAWRLGRPVSAQMDLQPKSGPFYRRFSMPFTENPTKPKYHKD